MKDGDENVTGGQKTEDSFFVVAESVATLLPAVMWEVERLLHKSEIGWGDVQAQ